MVFETTASAIPPLRLGTALLYVSPLLLSNNDRAFLFDIGRIRLYNIYMRTSKITPALIPSGKRRPRSNKASVFVSLGCLMLFGSWAYWYNEHRAIPWSLTFSPAYWLSRYRGDDMFETGNAFLWHGNRHLPEVALTFDDGPHTESRASILDTLKKMNVRATFFDVGMRMAQNPDLVLRTLAEGHEEANHSYTHRRLDEVSPRDLHREVNDPDIAYYRITGRHLTLMRPPGMRYNSTVLKETYSLGYIVVGYNAASGDFEKQERPEYIVKRTIDRTENGSIILLHDYAGTAAALQTIIQALSAKGYRFVTISEMIDHLPPRARNAAWAYQKTQASGL